MLSQSADAATDLQDDSKAVALEPSSNRIGRSARSAFVVLCCAGSVALFFRYQIANGFTRLFSDRFDGMIAIAILEHWYNVLRGLSRWSQTEFFYPIPNTIGYTDAYFVNGMIYSGFRAVGLDPFLAGEISNVTLRTVGFLGAYLAGRRVFGLTFGWALLAATLFTLSSSSFNHAIHIQLLTISFAPIMAVLLHGTVEAVLSGRSGALLAWGSASSLLYAAWMMTGYYMAWYFAYFTAATLIAFLLLLQRQERSALIRATGRQWLPLMVLAVIAVVVNLPFLYLYLPKMSESGEQTYQLALSPSLLDIFNVGPSNVVYGHVVRMVHDLVDASSPLFSERTTGITPVLLGLFTCACVAMWRGKKDTPALSRALCLAAVATWITVLHVGHLSFWFVVYHLLPGASAMRATGRYQIFLAAPVIIIAVRFLCSNADRWRTPVLILISALLVVEQLDYGSSLQLDRTMELARLRSVPQRPTGCKVFFASRARPATTPYRIVEDRQSHNVDSMLIAEYQHLPTINGMGSVLPPGWALYAPEKPSYIAAVTRFVTAHRVDGLCALDLRTMRWDPAPHL